MVQNKNKGNGVTGDNPCRLREREVSWASRRMGRARIVQKTPCYNHKVLNRAKHFSSKVKIHLLNYNELAGFWL